MRYRYSTELETSVQDILASISYLQDEGIEAVALIGHSFGGAAVIRTAALSAVVRTIVTLATQAYGTEVVPQLATQCSLLLLHGTADPVLPPSCSQWVYQLALEPKRLILYPEATHGLDEVAVDVHQVVHEWVTSIP